MCACIIWKYVLSSAPLLHFGDFLDHKDFAVFVITSRSMQEKARIIIRARNNRLPMGKRMANLEGALSEVYKKLLQLEGRYPLDIIATGGEEFMGKIVNTVMSLDLVTMRYTTLVPLITARYEHATAMLDGKLFVIGGDFNYGSLPSVECLDLETGQRSEKSPMITPREKHGAAVIGDKIYVVGGDPVYTVGTLVESYDPATNQWTAEAPMNTGRYYHGLVSVQGKLFAVGGWNNLQYNALSSVECFDPSTGVWSYIAPLSTARSSLAVAVLGDKLYAIGGYDSHYQFLSSVECLDLSVPNSEWTTVAPMTIPRYGMGAVVSGGKIYIAGGYGFGTIQCFDPNDGPVGRWTVISETSEFEIRATISSF